MDTYWVRGANNLGSYGRWAFSEFTEVYRIESDFEAKLDSEFNRMIKMSCPKKGTEWGQLGHYPSFKQTAHKGLIQEPDINPTNTTVKRAF